MALEKPKQALNAKIPAITAINEGMLPGIQKVGEKFQAGEFFLTELIVAGGGCSRNGAGLRSL